MAKTADRVPAGPVAVAGIPDGTVLYDGVCVLCSGWFRFVAARDAACRFRWVQIQDGYGRRMAAAIGIDPDDPQTNAVVVGGMAYVRSDAAIQVLSGLPGWSWTRHLMRIPRVLRDMVYIPVARHRYRLFGRTDICMIPPADLKPHLFLEPPPNG